MVGKTISHYHILEKLGEGGMGVVYLAHDTRLDRDVALKFLPQHLAASEQDKARFIQEAKAASALDHPNICNIHEINETDDGQFYIVMAYYEGETLKNRIISGESVGAIPRITLKIDECINIAIQIAEGLGKAHEKGIIHRDIKPANIIVTADGTAKILDFGLAKLGGQTLLTKTGTTVGTAAYMSPEQARGEEVDHRTDIWSFGVVLYEMITGQLPFKGEYEQAVIYSILNEEPAPISSLRHDIPAELERLVRKTMAKNPGVRFANAGEISAVLNSLAKKRETERDQHHSGTPETSPSIAVLPFVNMSPDPENEYFSDGLAEDIINALTQVPGLRVVARTSAFAFRGKQTDVREIGARLNVEHILEGSVRRAGNRIRVTAQLVKASDGYHLWSQRFDREMRDVFAIQDEISQAIVENLRLRLSAGRPLIKRYTENLAAYDLCLKARYYLLRMTHEGREAGRRHCEQAIALDPNYALAHVMLAESYFWSAFWGSMDPRQAFAEARSAAKEALRLDDTIADAHSALGTVLGSGEFDWGGAESEFHRALELSPSSSAVRYNFAWCYALWFLYPQGRVEQALIEMRRAVELDPLDPFYNTLVGYLLGVLRQFEPAIAQLQHTIDLDPSFFFSHWFLSITYTYNGRFEEAIAPAEKANELSGRHALTLGTLSSLYGRTGRIAEARQFLEELTARRRFGYVSSSALAWAHNGMGELDKSLEWIAKGIEERDPLLVTALKCAPTYNRLRSLPAFPALLRKMNLEP